MTAGTNGVDTSTLAPDDAFTVLGNETRIQILQTLGEADDPLSFSALRNRIGLRDSGQFNYHLDKLVGHFVQKTPDGYTLRQPGRRLVEAVLSGAVTTTPKLEPTQLDETCPYCGAPTEVYYREEFVGLRCTECEGTYGESFLETESTGQRVRQAGRGFLGELNLPPAGIQGRTAAEVLDTANTWGGLNIMMAASGVCPRCSATVEDSVRVCKEHGTTDGVCDQCGLHHAILWRYQCTNCIHEEQAPFLVSLLDNSDVLEFLITHGINPVDNVFKFDWDYDEELLSAEPFEAQFTITIDDDVLTLTVGDELSITDISEA